MYIHICIYIYEYIYRIYIHIYISCITRFGGVWGSGGWDGNVQQVAHILSLGIFQALVSPSLRRRFQSNTHIAWIWRCCPATLFKNSHLRYMYIYKSGLHGQPTSSQQHVPRLLSSALQWATLSSPIPSFPRP